MTMKLFRTLPLIAAMSLAFSGAARAQSLVELFDVARDFDASFKSVQLQAQATKLKVEQAQAKLGPSVNLNLKADVNSLNSNYINTVPTGFADNTRGYSVQSGTVAATQPLYRPADNAEVSQANLQLKLADEQLRAAEQDLMVRLSQVYFDVLASQDTLTFVQAQMKAVAEQLASAKRNFEVGTTTITDTREAQATYDLVVAQEIAASNDLRVKKMALEQLVGKSGLSPKAVALSAMPEAPQPANVEEWVLISEQQNASVKQARIGVDVAQLETKKADAGLRPTLDAQLSYTYQNNVNGGAAGLADSRMGVATGAVVLNWPLYTGNALNNRVRETLSLANKAQSDLDNAARNIAQATRAAYFGVVSGVGQVKALKAAEESSQVALEANQLGYSVGVRININVLDAQSKLYDTKAKLAKARYDVLVGHLKLRQLSGSLQLQDLQDINKLLAP
jgi:outer membrane protein